MTIHRQGSIVPESGIYDVIHCEQHKPHDRKHQVTCIEGKRFPPCRDCGTDVQYQLFRGAIHIADHPLLRK